MAQYPKTVIDLKLTIIIAAMEDYNKKRVK